MKKCTNCGVELDDKAMFCMECGTKQLPQTVKCVECGAELPSGAKFCQECGAKQVPKKKFCTNCGTELQEGMKFCMECGTPAQATATTIAQPNSTEGPSRKEQSKNVKANDIPAEDICTYKVFWDEDEMCGFEDEDENEVIEAQFDDADDFSYGLAPVCLDDEWGFIKPDGSYFIKPKFSDANAFREGLAAVKLNGKYGYIKTDGKYQIKPKFEDAGNFHNGMAPVKLKGKYGFIDMNGDQIVDFKFDYIGDFYEGFAKVEIADKYGFITQEGRYLVKPYFDSVDNFEDGCAEVQIGRLFVDKVIKKGKIYADGTYEMDGKKMHVSELYGDILRRERDENGKYGFVDSDEDWIIPPKFDKVWEFKDGIALVLEGDKYGYIKKDGSYLIEPKYEDADSFSNGFASFKEDGKYGFIRTDGSVYVKPMFDKSSYFDETYAPVEVNGLTCYLYPDGKIKVGSSKFDIDKYYRAHKPANATEDNEDTDEKKNDAEDELSRMARLGDALKRLSKSMPSNNDPNSIWYDGSNEEYENGPQYEPQESMLKKGASAVFSGIKSFAKAASANRSSSSSSSSSSSKNVRKVWTCYYKGSHNAAPGMLSVPSSYSSGGPSAQERYDALIAMGYSESQANAIKGSNLDWDFQ